MDSRYKELASGKVGERQHELITVISDEWTTVSKHIQNLNRYLLPLLTESRNAKYYYLVKCLSFEISQPSLRTFLMFFLKK
jgi:hypothetical protein